MFEHTHADRPAEAGFAARWPAGPAQFAAWADECHSSAAGTGTDAVDVEADLPDADPWQAGFAAGLAAAEAAMTADTEAMAALAAALDRLAPLPDAQFAQRLEADVRALLRVLIGSASIDESLLVSRCDALAALATGEGDAVLCAHPADAALLSAARPALTIQTDERLPRGELVLTNGAGEAAAGPATMLNDWDAQRGEAPC